VLALTWREQSVSDLVQTLKQPQSTVSRHLTLLRQNQLVNTRREAARVYYRLEDTHLSALVVETFSHTEHERRSLPDHPLSPDPPSSATTELLGIVGPGLASLIAAGLGGSNLFFLDAASFLGLGLLLTLPSLKAQRSSETEPRSPWRDVRDSTAHL